MGRGRLDVAGAGRATVSSIAMPRRSSDVSKAKGRTDGTLRLSFSRGGVLEIYDDSKQYESYQIQHGKDLYVV